jgi:hypothetical protein
MPRFLGRTATHKSNYWDCRLLRADQYRIHDCRVKQDDKLSSFHVRPQFYLYNSITSLLEWSSRPSKTKCPPLARSGNVGGSSVNVRYWHKADIPNCTAHVRFRGYSRRRLDITDCPLIECIDGVCQQEEIAQPWPLVRWHAVRVVQ